MKNTTVKPTECYVFSQRKFCPSEPRKGKLVEYVKQRKMWFKATRYTVSAI